MYKQPEFNGNYTHSDRGGHYRRTLPAPARRDDSSEEGSCSSTCGSHGDGSDSNSTTEEEKLKRLFQTCDTDGDGFIDG